MQHSIYATSLKKAPFVSLFVMDSRTHSRSRSRSGSRSRYRYKTKRDKSRSPDRRGDRTYLGKTEVERKSRRRERSDNSGSRERYRSGIGSVHSPHGSDTDSDDSDRNSRSRGQPDLSRRRVSKDRSRYVTVPETLRCWFGSTYHFVIKFHLFLNICILTASAK